MLSDNQDDVEYQRAHRITMSVLKDRVCIDEVWANTNYTGCPLIASEYRILSEKMNDAFLQFQESKIKLEECYTKNREKKIPSEEDYNASRLLGLERDRAGEIYEKYTRKHARETAKKEGKLCEYEKELDGELEKEWQDWQDYCFEQDWRWDHCLKHDLRWNYCFEQDW